MSEDGPAAVNGRLKDIINAGGFNISPADVERAMLGHPAVREAAVIGVPEDYRDETARMIVSLRRGEQLDLKHLKEFLSGRLSPMEIPTILSIATEIPRNEKMKISRQGLRKREGLAPRGTGRSDRAAELRRHPAPFITEPRLDQVAFLGHRQRRVLDHVFLSADHLLASQFN